MKVTYLQESPLPKSGDVYDLVDVPENVEFRIKDRWSGGEFGKTYIYWREGNDLHYRGPICGHATDYLISPDALDTWALII